MIEYPQGRGSHFYYRLVTPMIIYMMIFRRKVGEGGLYRRPFKELLNRKGGIKREGY